MSLVLSIAKCVLVSYFVVYALVHSSLYLTPEVGRYLVFQNLIRWPFSDLKNPVNHGLTNVHNFYVDVEQGVRVGVWHFIPTPTDYVPSQDSSKTNQEHFARFVQNDNKNMVIYVHGNDRDRSAPFRVNLCNNLVKLGYHVFAIDYRGYGDSTGWPSETGVVKDVISLYNMIKSYNKDGKLFFYGHSLGTGIVSHAAKVLSEKNQKINGVILEAPFLNISQACKDYHVGKLLLNNDWIKKTGDEALEKLNIHFNNDKNILKINAEILIMHAEDDWFIPQDHSKELYKICLEKRPKHYPKVTLVEYEKEHGLGHFIHTHMPAYDLIKTFIESL